MIESGDYPAGTEYTKDAPWNEHLKKPVKIKVTVSMTLSKEFEIEVDDYNIEDDGTLDFSDCDLKAAVRDQIYLPDEAGNNIEFLKEKAKTDYKVYETVSKKMIEEFKDWNVDDFEVITDD